MLAAPGGVRAQSADSAPGKPGEGVWAGYDFVAGDRVLFYHDFEGSRTGNFPSRLDYIAGNLEVVELEGNKLLRAGEGDAEGGPSGNGCFTIALPETLPERFTIEYRVRSSDPLHRVSVRLFSDGSDNTPDPRCTYPPKLHVAVEGASQGLVTGGAARSVANQALKAGEWYDIRIAADGPYWKMYVNEKRVANVPKYEFPRADKLHVFMQSYRYSIFVDDIRIAEGGPRSLYDDLAGEGFVSTTAIRFDSGSATLKPESTGILNEVLAMLKEHADLSLVVEGHTDSQGADEANLALSKQRAETVVTWLASRGIDAGRLSTIGYGESKPVADNSTPEGMAQNRHVVFRKT